ncbi:hypothetical protein TorRG33x02_188640, partial [Trema orientale]
SFEIADMIIVVVVGILTSSTTPTCTTSLSSGLSSTTTMLTSFTTLAIFSLRELCLEKLLLEIWLLLFLFLVSLQGTQELFYHHGSKIFSFFDDSNNILELWI